MRFETASIRSVLGLRFRDATTERPVTEGLQVTVRRKDGSGPPTRAVRTVSGAYVAQGLAGLRAYERVPEDIPEDIPEDPSELNNEDPSNLDNKLVKEDYLVDVRDQRGRFVPVLMKVKLPYTPKQKHRWLYPVFDPPPEEQLEGDGAPEPTVYLFSAVQRPVPAGQGVVYADLVTKNGGTWQPAAHALMEIRHELKTSSDGNQNKEEVWYGVADADGRVAVQFPLPTIQLVEVSGNETESRGPQDTARPAGLSALSGRTVSIEVLVYHDPDLQTLEGAPRPRLKPIMNQHTRNPRPIYETTEATSKPLTAKFSFGKPLVLKTGDLSVLRIAPANSES